MLAPCAQIERQTHRRYASGAGTETYDARVLDPLALQFQRIEQARAQHDRGAVLVVVEHRNVAALDQRAFDLEAGGCGDVFEVDAAKGRTDAHDGVDEFLRIPGIDLDIDYVDIGKLFEQHRSEEHTSEIQSLMRHSYAVFC